MAAKKRKTSVIKVKKKKWFPIHASEHFSHALLGETYINEESELAGKYITANLSTITKSMRKQNINVQFKVDKVEEGKAFTKIIGYSMIAAAVKRLVRRGRDKITDSFLAKTKNKEVLRIKPLIITSSKGTKALQTAIRLESRRIIRESVFSNDTAEVFAELVDGKIQKKMKEAIAKLTPVRSCEVRMAKIDENTNVVLTDDGVKTEKVTIRRREKGNQLEGEKKEKTQAEEYEEAQSSENFGDEDDAVVANDDEFDEEETAEEELEEASEEELDEEDEEMVVQKEEPSSKEASSEDAEESDDSIELADDADEEEKDSKKK